MCVGQQPILALIAVSVIVTGCSCQSLMEPPAAAAASDELSKLVKMEERLASAELCASSIGGEAGKMKKWKIALVNYTDSFVTENYCCSIGGNRATVSCSFKYKPMYYFLCTISGIALGLFAILGIVALVYRCRNPWDMFNDLLSRPLMTRSSLSIRSEDAASAASQIADTSVDSVIDCQQPKAQVNRWNDDRLLSDIF